MIRIASIIGAGLLAAGLTTTQAQQRPQPTPEQQAAQKARADATAADHQNMLDQLKITNLRRGRDGNDPSSPYRANYDESKANPFPNWPDPLTFKDGKKVTNASEWPKRRAEIEEDFSREIYGRVPKNVPRVTWRVLKDTDQVVNNIPVNFKQLVGHVDNSAYPAINVDIQLTLMVPKNAGKPVPVVMVYGGQDFLNPRPAGAFGFGGPPRQGAANQPRPKTAQEQVLEKGWAFATLLPGSVQPDDGAGFREGIIGLANKGQYRKPDDWGVLRAWAWGADRALDYFETNKAVDAKKVALEGHSRWGKATLVAMAFNPRLATGYVSSSGQGGAKPGRRDAGEVVENLTSKGGYHWMAGNFIKYGGPLNWNDLPVDSHELIALCAPRPVFISSGEKGDEWVDAKGMFMAADAAGPVYTLLGKKAIQVHEFPKVETLLNGDVAWRQHQAGHTDGPNWPYFLTFAERYFK